MMLLQGAALLLFHVPNIWLTRLSAALVTAVMAVDKASKPGASCKTARSVTSECWWVMHQHIAEIVQIVIRNDSRDGGEANCEAACIFIPASTEAAQQRPCR
jgi:hypothetical protein